MQGPTGLAYFCVPYSCRVGPASCQWSGTNTLGAKSKSKVAVEVGWVVSWEVHILKGRTVVEKVFLWDLYKSSPISPKEIGNTQQSCLSCFCWRQTFLSTSAEQLLLYSLLCMVEGRSSPHFFGIVISKEWAWPNTAAIYMSCASTDALASHPWKSKLRYSWLSLFLCPLLIHPFGT